MEGKAMSVKRMLPIDHQLVRRLFDYCPADAAKPLIRRVATPNGGRRSRVGDRVGYLDPRGYVRMALGDTRYGLHRIVWVWHHGACSPSIIDHIDGNPSNNLIENLREAGPVGNSRNRRSARNSSSRYLGVSRCGSVWKAQINANRKRFYLGQFTDEASAALAYDTAAREHHGEYARLNFPEETPDV